VLTRWQGGFATVAVVAIACGLVAADLAYGGFRRWWAAHALTTDMVAGLLVLLITVLLVDQLLGRRQIRDRSRAMGAQAVIMVEQARRSDAMVTAALNGGDRDSALDELRTYMMMLLVSAPVLIEANASRTFLEEAQWFGGEMARALGVTRHTAGPVDVELGRLAAALDRMNSAAAPLLRVLDFGERAAAASVDAPS